MTFQRSQRYTKPALSTGVLSIDGDPTQVISTSDNATVDVLGGQGIIMERNSLGENILREVTWLAQNNVVLPTTDGIISVNIDQDGLVNLDIGAAIPLPDVRKTKIFIGVVTVASGFIGTLSIIGEPAYDHSGAFVDALLTMGPVNSSLDPFNAVPNGVEILGNKRQFKMTTGSEMLPDIGTFLNSQNPHIFSSDVELNPLIVILGRQSNATFSVSPTAELNPDIFEAKGDVTKFSVSGINTRVSSNAHGLSVGDSVEIFSPIPEYNKTHIVISESTNNFDIAEPFVGDDLTLSSTWIALTAVPPGNFTVLRGVLFPTTGFIGLYFGTVAYTTSAIALANFQALEPFVELGPSVTAIRIFDIVIEQGETDIANAVFVPGPRSRL